MNLPGLNFQLGEDIDALRDAVRAFAEAESLVALGKLADARGAYLKLGDIQDAHPFAAERLLSLLVADPQAHELALDIASSLLRRRDRSPTALWGEAIVRERRGELARAAAGTRIALVTDRGIVSSGLLRPALDSLEAAGVTASVLRGVDAAPAGLLDGAASIAGTTIWQTVHNGVAGVYYTLEFTATTSLGHVLIERATLEVTA